MMRLRVPCVHVFRLPNVKFASCKSTTVVSSFPISQLPRWRSNVLRIRSFTNEISGMLLQEEKWYPTSKKPSRRKTPEDQQAAQEYAAMVEAAWKNQDRKAIDQVFDEILRNGQFTKEILSGIFSFYVDQQDVPAILRFAEAFHINKQPAQTNWYNKALLRVSSAAAKQQIYEEMKKRAIPVSLVARLTVPDTDTSLDFEKAIQDYKENSTPENVVQLGKCIADQLTRDEPNKENRIMQQLLDAQIVIPLDICYIMLRHAAWHSKSQLAHDICSHIKAKDLRMPASHVHSLLLLLDSFTPHVRSLVNSLSSLLWVQTEEDRAMKELCFLYVHRKQTPPGAIQEKLEVLTRSCPSIVDKSLYHRLSLWAQIGSPFEMILASHHKLTVESRSAFDVARLDVTLLEICPLYQAHYQAIDVAEKLKTIERFNHQLYPPLFHALLVASRDDLFQQYFEEYFARSPGSAMQAAFAVTSRYGFPDALKWCMETSEAKGRIVPPRRKYRLLLESAIAANNETLVEKLWGEYSSSEPDATALRQIILFFKQNLEKVEELAKQSEQLVIRKAMIEVYIWHKNLKGVMTEWSKIQKPYYSTYTWMLRRIRDTKFLLDVLNSAIIAFPQHKLAFQKIVIANCMKRGHFHAALEWLSVHLSSMEPEIAYVDPALVTTFEKSLKRPNALKFLPRFIQLCEQYPNNTETNLALKILKLQTENSQV